MNKKTIIFCAALVLCICLAIVSLLPLTRREPLKLELVLSDTVYKANEPIECKAILSYVGSEESFQFYSGDPVIMFAIGGGEYFNGETDLLNKGQRVITIQKNNPIESPFVKYQGWHLNSDAEAAAFWQSFLNEEDLVLEPGDYVIYAQCAYALEQGGEYTIITTSKRITVE